LYGKVFLTLNLTGLCPKKTFSTVFFNFLKKINPPLVNIFLEKFWPEIKICCRASSVLAGQFWQTPPELKGLVSPLAVSSEFLKDG
jgi:hypothetical protein